MVFQNYSRSFHSQPAAVRSASEGVNEGSTFATTAAAVAAAGLAGAVALPNLVAEAQPSPTDASILGLADMVGIQHGGNTEKAATALADMFGVKVIDQEMLDKIMAVKASNPNNLAVKNFDPKYYEKLSNDERAALIQIVRSGVENPDSGMGCYAMQVGAQPRQ